MRKLKDGDVMWLVQCYLQNQNRNSGSCGWFFSPDPFSQFLIFAQDAVTSGDLWWNNSQTCSGQARLVWWHGFLMDLLVLPLLLALVEQWRENFTTLQLNLNWLQPHLYFMGGVAGLSGQQMMTGRTRLFPCHAKIYVALKSFHTITFTLSHRLAVSASQPAVILIWKLIGSYLALSKDKAGCRYNLGSSSHKYTWLLRWSVSMSKTGCWRNCEDSTLAWCSV